MATRKAPIRYRRHRWHTECSTMKKSNRNAPCRNRGSKPCLKCDVSKAYCPTHAKDHNRYHLKR